MWYTLDGFQSTPPRGGRHEFANTCTIPNFVFQSTPPARGATYVCILPRQGGAISIHAPREGGDQLRHQLVQERRDFNPRPPRGGRRAGHAEGYARHGHFNPRPPRGGRRKLPFALRRLVRFQSTPPARGATASIRPCVKPAINFNPRPPRGGRPRTAVDADQNLHFNPRPPRGGRPRPCPQTSSFSDFNPRPPRGGRPRHGDHGGDGAGISIHAPREGGDSTTQLKR